MAGSLYEELGVPRDAPAAAVRKAYRRAAAKAHPDVGGSRERFDRVKLAHDVLTDPLRRLTYDETGRVDEKPIDNFQANVMQLAMQSIEEAMSGGSNRLLEQAKHLLEIRLRNIADQRGIAKKKATAIRKIGDRFKAKRGKSNIISPMFSGKAAELERNIEKSDHDERLAKAALDVLAQHTFEEEGEPARPKNMANGFVTLGGV